MYKAPTITRKLPRPVALMLVLIVSAGCSLSPARLLGPEYYLIDIPECKAKPLLSDEKVLDCTDKVKGILRERMNNARLARTAGGFLQVVTAAVSALLTGAAGTAALDAATILSGTSAIIPEVSEVIGAKERAEAYGDGVKSIETAEAIYRKAIAATQEGSVSRTKLTPEGARLYEAIVAAVHVVEARLIGLLPTVEELRKSRSELETIEVVPAGVSLKPGDATTVQVAQGGPVTTAGSTNDVIARVEQLVNNNTGARIKAGNELGQATITFSNSRGGSGVLTVTVENEPFRVSRRDVPELIINQTETIEVTSGSPVIHAESSDPKVAEVTHRGTAVVITGKKAGKAVVSIENRSGRWARIEVTVAQ